MPYCSHDVRAIHVNKHDDQTHGVAFCIHAATIRVTIVFERSEGGEAAIASYIHDLRLPFGIQNSMPDNITGRTDVKLRQRSC